MQDNKKLYGACFYAFFYCGILSLTLGSALPDMRAAYNLSDTISGALLSCYSLGNLASGIIIGAAMLALGQKLSITILAAFVVIGISILTFSSVPAILLAACILVGLGRGSMISFSQRTINLLTDGNAKISAMLHATFAVGAICAPLIFSALRVISWKAGLSLLAFMGVLIIVWLVMIKNYSCIETKSGDEQENKNAKSFAFFRDRGFLIISALMFLYLCCEFAVNGWIVTYMHYKNMSMSFSHSMAALLWVVMLIGRLICIWLAKYSSQQKILLVLSVGATICFALMLHAEGAFYITLSVAALGLCMSGISPIIYASSAPYTNKFPLAMGILFTIGCTGGTLMPFITGLVAELYGFDGGMSAILVAFVLLIIFAVINVRRKEA